MAKKISINSSKDDVLDFTLSNEGEVTLAIIPVKVKKKSKKKEVKEEKHTDDKQPIKKVTIPVDEELLVDIIRSYNFLKPSNDLESKIDSLF